MPLWRLRSPSSSRNHPRDCSCALEIALRTPCWLSAAPPGVARFSSPGVHTEYRLLFGSRQPIPGRRCAARRARSLTAALLSHPSFPAQTASGAPLCRARSMQLIGQHSSSLTARGACGRARRMQWGRPRHLSSAYTAMQRPSTSPRRSSLAHSQRLASARRPMSRALLQTSPRPARQRPRGETSQLPGSSCSAPGRPSGCLRERSISHRGAWFLR